MGLMTRGAMDGRKGIHWETLGYRGGGWLTITRHCQNSGGLRALASRRKGNY